MLSRLSSFRFRSLVIVPQLLLNYQERTRSKQGRTIKCKGVWRIKETKKRIDQIEALESQECDGSNHKDPYGEVMKKPEHSGRVRLYGKGITKTDLKLGGKQSTYLFPEQYLESMQSQVLEQVLQANLQLHKLLEAKPDVLIVLPTTSNCASNERSQGTDSNGQTSLGAQSDNQLVHDEANLIET